MLCIACYHGIAPLTPGLFYARSTRAGETDMTVTIEHCGMRLVLDVYREDDDCYFGIRGIECNGEYLPVREFAELLLSEGLEIERKAYAQLEHENREAA